MKSKVEYSRLKSALAWALRLVVLSALFCFAIYWGAWRTGIAHFGCMQPTSSSMLNRFEMLANPFFNAAVDLSFFLWMLGVCYSVLQVRYGIVAFLKFRLAARAIGSHWYVWIPLTGIFTWSIFHNWILYRSGVAWIALTGIVCFLILIGDVFESADNREF